MNPFIRSWSGMQNQRQIHPCLDIPSPCWHASLCQRVFCSPKFREWPDIPDSKNGRLK